MDDQSRHILVVEDRADWQDIISTTLKQYDYIPHSAFSYQEALDALQAEIFCLAVVDPVLDMINRFNRDGLSVIQKIREIQPLVPVVILTGSLTHDMEISLQHLYPNAPILFKESWSATEFNSLVDELADQLEQNQLIDSPQQVDLSSNAKTSLIPPSSEKAVGRPRILLVENRKDWQDIVTTVLDEADYFWRIAQNAQEALLELEKEGFHLVILDLKLQQTDLPLRSNEGWLLLDYLVEKHPKTRVIILSGKAGPGDVAHLLTHYPVIGFIEKQNFMPEQITEAVIQAVRSPSLRIQSFGQFQIWRDGQAIGMWDNAQAETVAKLLLVRQARGGKAVAADEMITRFWPDVDEERGRRQLLPLISSVRRTLEPDIGPRDSNFILRSANGYYFFDISESVSWDLLEFRDYLALGAALIEQGQWAEAVIQLERGRTLYRGDFLAEDRYTDWVIDSRREITTDYCSLLVQLADAYAALENYTKAIEACDDALSKDPLLENVYRRLMQFHYCNGQKEQALKAYRNCIKLFEELFGENPAPATRQLYELISKDEPLDCSSLLVT